MEFTFLEMNKFLKNPSRKFNGEIRKEHSAVILEIRSNEQLSTTQYASVLSVTLELWGSRYSP